MRRNRRNDSKKERTIMIASSAFVLAALTMTGIYMKSNNAEEQDDGYTLDFTSLEENVDDKFQEIARNNQESQEQQPEADMGAGETGMPVEEILPETGHPQDDLDYLPMEAGSDLVTIPGLTDNQTEAGQNGVNSADVDENMDIADTGDTDVISPQEETPSADSEAAESAREDESANGNEVIAETLNFNESDGLLRPASGEVLIPFSMEGSVYFSTLDQFKYNPALMIAAEKGSAVVASARGQVVDIFQNEEIGHAVTMELGNGYRITYGQVENINVALGSYVETGETIATVAAPTKYYTVEGSNLYVKVTANGNPVNPELLFR